MIVLLSNPRIFQATVWLPLRAHIGRTALAVTAIALGVALGLAIFLMTRAATEETARASRSLFGQADFILQGAEEGFDESLYPIIARMRGIVAASPVVEMRVPVIGHRISLVILGKDFLHAARMQTEAHSSGRPAFRSRDALALFDAHSIQLSHSAAKTMQLIVGDSVTIQVGLHPVTLKVVGILPNALYPQNVGLMDIGAAQWQLEKLGKLSRIELQLGSAVEIDTRTDTASVLAAIEKVLPANVKLTTPADEAHQAEQLVRPIVINLLGVALVALFTGAFLVYSTQSLSIVRRRREFALLHALGVTAREQIASVVYTGTLLGVIGAVFGVGLGVILAKVGLKFIPTSVTQLELSPLHIAGFAVLGMLASVAGSLAPALTAARIPTAQALKSGNVTEASGRGHVYVAAVLWVAAIPLLLAPPVVGLPLFGYAAIASILFGGVLLIPAFTRIVLTLLPRLRNVGYQIAVAQLRGVAHTATTSVATMFVSVSLMVAMSIMGASLRGSMANWAEQMFPADLIVQTGYGLSNLNAETVHALASIDGVERADRVRSIPILLSKEQPSVTLGARRTDLLVLDEQARLPMPQGAVPIWINRVLADHEQRSSDDTVRFHIGGREIVGSVRGIYRDYFNPNGALAMDYEQYLDVTGDEQVNSLWLWLSADTHVETVMSKIRDRLGADIEVDISLPGDVRQRLLRGFDSLFAIIYLLLTVAVLIGLFGIGVNASAQVLARRAEFGVLRYLGFTRKQIGIVLSMEGLVLGVLGAFAGLAMGGTISAVMIYIVTPQSFHWTMDLYMPVTLLLSLALTVPTASALTALWSGRGAMNDDMVRAVKEDW